MQTNPTTAAIVSRGEKLYIDKIKNQVEPGLIGQYVAVDIVSGDFTVT